ncbi:F-box/kelch-repeat protein At1g15670-like [Musa acuminata AAA Group]|uniref:F-box/kelch-repeat protein At1g15670-like n=1 Tax=Musa acuminata AAA Group TaxID=214697 RepID=UPI0031DA8FCF
MIPGLTDDAARECLTRVPYNAFPTLFSVCKVWRQELRDPTFHRFRKSTGIAQPVVVLVQPYCTYYNSPGLMVYRFVIFEPATGVWSSLPPCPNLTHGLPHLCRLAAVGTELVVVGGWKIDTCLTTDEVHVYDFVSGEWRRGSPLPWPLRSSFACAATHDSDKGCRTVYVAGGHDGSANPLRSALAYDVGGDSWKPLPDMARKPFNCRGVILRGKFVVLHRHCAEAFDPAAGSWGPVEELVPPGEQYPTICVAGVDGSIYRCVGREVMVQLDGGVWATVAKLPSEMRVAMNAVAWEGKLMVMGIGMRNGALVAKILDIKATTTMTTPASASASWRNVEVPPEYQWHVEVACCLVI